MAGDMTAILSAVRTRMASLGFKESAAVFDFDAMPDTAIDRAFRIETRVVGNEYILGNKAITTEELGIYVAYKLKRKDMDALDAALDDREKIEKDIVGDATIAALAQGPILRMAGESMTVKYSDNYLVSKISLMCDYIRSLS